MNLSVEQPKRTQVVFMNNYKDNISFFGTVIAQFHQPKENVDKIVTVKLFLDIF